MSRGTPTHVAMAILAFIAPLRLAQAAAPARPNVVVILADDQGWGDLGVSGNRNLSTPNIDSLARDGAVFERFFVCPVCSPTRAEFLTGRYHVRGGVYSTSAGGERLDLDERTIAETFKTAGYATGAFGKWHNGWQWPYHPNARGFDEYYGFCSGHWGHYFDPVLDHNGKLVRGKGFIIDDLTDHATRFMADNRDRPFFCYIPYNTPHSPMQVPDRFYKKFDGAELGMRHRDPKKENVGHVRAVLAMCENIDWNVGRILKKLDELELAENTIIVYFSDNGPNGARWNGGMKGRKGSTDEGGVRVPCLWRWPAKIKPGTKVPGAFLGAAIDLLPTLADMAGIEVTSKKPLDGMSLKERLLGRTPPALDRTIFNHWKGRTSARNGRFRLDHTGRLFDMRTDPGQKTDVSKQHPDAARAMKQKVDRWRKEVASGPGKDDRAFLVGYDGHKVNHLPARDGIAHGNVKRSNKFPNCSFFTNWTAPEDRITWDVEVCTAGRYEATVYYTCAESDVGATVELSFGNAKVCGKVTEAHAPPLVGAAQDRVKRAESYVKDFKPMSLGVLVLERGEGSLALRAVDVPGRQVMEVRYVVLTRID